MSLKICSATAAALFLSACSGTAENASFNPSYPFTSFDKSAPDGGIVTLRTYRALAQDSIARNVGDILSVRLVERTQASKSASASAGRESDFSARLPETPPFSYIPRNLLSGGSSQKFKGQGNAAQSNQLSGDITVIVEQTYPNGTLLIRGEKQVSLNRGMEFIRITGLIRLQDIGPDNRIDSYRVANARINYSGKGEIAAHSKQGWLQRFFTQVTPF